MRKKLILLAALAIPACLYLNVWQAFRYRMVETQVEHREDQQQMWLENNKKIIIGIEVLGAPSRIDGLASNMEALENPKRPAVIRIVVDSEKSDG
jgi:hypothetical protein